MKIQNIPTFLLGLSVTIQLISSNVLQKMEFKMIQRIVGQEVLEKYIGKSQLTVVYYYKKGQACFAELKLDICMRRRNKVRI